MWKYFVRRVLWEKLYKLSLGNQFWFLLWCVLIAYIEQANENQEHHNDYPLNLKHIQVISDTFPLSAVAKTWQTEDTAKTSAYIKKTRTFNKKTRLF